MMNIANTLKSLLPKVGFTWNALLLLFYSLCGWLVIGTLIPIAGASSHTPVGTLRRLLDWLDVPSSFTSGMERWCGSRADFLFVLGFIVLAVSIAAATVACGGGWSEVFTGIEVPAFLFGLALWLQSDAPVWLCGAVAVIAWFCTAFKLGFFVEFREWFRCRRTVIPSDDGMIFEFFAWPVTLAFALCYPLLTLVRLLLGGVTPNSD